MAPPYWIHCNICVARFDKDHKLFMLTCSHTICGSCMKNSERGTRCPLCKKPCKYQEMTKLPDKTKSFFAPNIIDTLTEPLNKIEFQRKQQENLMKLSESFNLKQQKADQMKANLENQHKKLKAEYERTVKQRKLMQQKLREIQTKREQQGISNYRSPSHETLSPGSSTGTVSTSSTTSSTRTGQSSSKASLGSFEDFFDKDPPMRAQGSDKSPVSWSGSGVKEATNRSQSSRKPFFT